MNLEQILLYLEEHPSIYVAGAAVSTLIVAYFIYRLFLGKKPKINKGKPKKRSNERKKQEAVEPAVPAKEAAENNVKNFPPRSVASPKKSERPSPKTPTKRSPVPSKNSKEEQPQPVALETEGVDDEWITVSGKKDPKVESNSPGKASAKSKAVASTKSPGGKNKTSKASKHQSRQGVSGSAGEPRVEHPGTVNPTSQDADEDTEEEWREVRFSRKGGKYKRNE